MNQFLRRLERLEREQTRPDSCLACDLSRVDGNEPVCDRQSCSTGLATLLMGLRHEPNAAA